MSQNIIRKLSRNCPHEVHAGEKDGFKVLRFFCIKYISMNYLFLTSRLGQRSAEDTLMTYFLCFCSYCLGIKSNLEFSIGRVSSPYWPGIKSNIELSLYTVETQLFQMTSDAAKRGTCIKGLIRLHLEPKFESCFSLISSDCFSEE